MPAATASACVLDILWLLNCTNHTGDLALQSEVRRQHQAPLSPIACSAVQRHLQLLVLATVLAYHPTLAH